LSSISTQVNSNVSTVRYGGFWLRFLAMIIDGIILLVIGMGISSAILFFNLLTMSEEVAELLYYSVVLILALFYYIFLESSSLQATIGKWMLGMKVTTLDGKRIGIGRAIGRLFGKYISAIPFYIGYLMTAFTSKKQALHDMMAGCVIVRK